MVGTVNKEIEMFEYWMQDSKIKGLRLQKFKVESKNDQILSWVEEDGRLVGRYSRQELINNGWVFMEKIA
jgi:hypothetical protein